VRATNFLGNNIHRFFISRNPFWFFFIICFLIFFSLIVAYHWVIEPFIAHFITQICLYNGYIWPKISSQLKPLTLEVSMLALWDDKPIDKLSILVFSIISITFPSSVHPKKFLSSKTIHKGFKFIWQNSKVTDIKILSIISASLTSLSTSKLEEESSLG